MTVTKSNQLKIVATLGGAIGLACIMGFAATEEANAGNFNVDIYLGNGGQVHRTHKRHYKSERHHKRRSHVQRYQPQPYYSGQRYYNDNHYRLRSRNQYYQPRKRQICGQTRSVNTAYRLGMNQPRVHRIKKHKIVISGYLYGNPTKMVFKRYSACKLLKTVNFYR